MKAINLKKTEAVDYTYEAEDGSDEVNASISYTDNFEGWRGRVPAFKSAHPEMNGLRLKKVSATRLEGLLIKVTLAYKTLDANADYPGRPANEEPVKRYHIEAATSEEPLLTARIFQDLTDGKREALQELMNSPKRKEDFDKAVEEVGEDEIALKAIVKIRKGIEAYFNPGIIWVERYSTKNLATLVLDKVGNIVATVPGDPPAIGTRTWLYLSVTADQAEDGEFWDVERRFQASEPGGWDTDLYGEEGEEEED